MDKEAAQIAQQYIADAISVMQMNKPTERGEDARRWAIVITELEKVQAVALQFLKG